ncbi:MAG: DUF3089 domain-containing protein [Lachnospiraceae bacterium]|nr:DUF3089 domain-containing protein [Lachnospiraceae bacterium]
MLGKEKKRFPGGLLLPILILLLAFLPALAACGGQQPPVTEDPPSLTGELPSRGEESPGMSENPEPSGGLSTEREAAPAEASSQERETLSEAETVPSGTPAPTLPEESAETPSATRPQRPTSGKTVPLPTAPTEESREPGDILSRKVPDYSRESNWAFLAEGEEKAADVFFVAPTVIDEGVYLRLSDEEGKGYFRDSVKKEKGLYDGVGTFYAPYYRQMAAEVYKWPALEQRFWRDQAFRDVSAAFRYYLDHYDCGKPLIIAGFSQGSELCIRLIQQFFNPETQEGRELTKRLVAVYAIGAGLPETTVEKYPWLKAAEAETDLGGIICFDCELPGVTGSVLLPAGSRSLTINPLSWSRSTEPAEAWMNQGACFFAGDEIFLEQPYLCGCYIEPERGALIVTGINPAHFPTDEADVLPPGNLHEYDYQFFYRNIQENVEKRLEAYFEAEKKAP